MSESSRLPLFDDQKSILFAAGLVAIILVSVVLIWWVLKPSYEVLMAAPDEANLAKAIQELDAHGIAYQVAENGENVLVDTQDSAKARKALSELGLPYEATVGLELFANSDFGVTEFAQKVNYKRALEGELTRTISSLAEVRYARVHLVLPEKKLFDKKQNEATAAITLFLRDGIFLDAEQIKGIQRLVSHSVPSVELSNVTILDQNGMTLSGALNNSADPSLGSFSSMKEKRNHEVYIRNKIERLLSTRLQGTDFSVEVDVQLTSVSSKVVEKTLLPLTDNKGALIVSKYSSNKSDAEKGGSQGKTNEEQYQYGSRVEEKFNAAGQQKKVSIAVSINDDLDDTERAQLETLITAIAGLDKDRGDFVAVAGILRRSVEPSLVVSEADLTTPKTESDSVNNEKNLNVYLEQKWIIMLLVGLVLMVVVIIVLLGQLASAKRKAQESSLTSKQKEQLLNELAKMAEKS